MEKDITKESDCSKQIESLSNELRNAKQNLVDQFYTDPLTRLPNLYKLRADLEATSSFTLLIVNIDNFKILNPNC